MDSRSKDINRRNFLSVAAAAAGAASLASAGGAMAATQSENGGGQAMRPLRYWMHGLRGDDPKATAAALAEAGFDVVVAGGQANIAAVREAGMTSWLCGGAFGLGQYREDDEHKAVSVTGTPEVWFNSGCPNDAAIREQNLESYTAMAATEGVEGILVDGCRFASPASGVDAFFTCFDDACQDKAAKLGYDFDAMKRDAAAAHALLRAKPDPLPTWMSATTGVLEWLTRHPGVLEWLSFRRDCALEHFCDVEAIIHGAGKKMGVYIFTPSVAPLVGQSYVRLAEFMDVFCPMIYRNYPDSPGPACLNWELTALPIEAGYAGTEGETAVTEIILQWAGLADVVTERSLHALRDEMPPASVGHQSRMARELLGPDQELAPIIYIDDPKMAETAQSVREAGVDGLNFFVFKDNWRELTAPALKA